jgi:hypothetical protein
MTLASCNDRNMTRSERPVENGTLVPDIVAPQTLGDKLKRTDPAEHGRTWATFRLRFEIKRLLADSVFRLVSHLVDLTPMCDGLLPTGIRRRLRVPCQALPLRPFGVLRLRTRSAMGRTAFIGIVGRYVQPEIHDLSADAGVCPNDDGAQTKATTIKTASQQILEPVTRTRETPTGPDQSRNSSTRGKDRSRPLGGSTTQIGSKASVNEYSCSISFSFSTAGFIEMFGHSGREGKVK